MHIGLVAFVTEYSIPVSELAAAAEQRGFESLFVTEHTHIPASRDTPYAGGRPLPEEYRHTYDPFVALATAAAVTSDLRLGTGVCLVTERDPIVLAKEVASLDRMSGGRFLFGVGAGWNLEEMRNHGIDPARRWTIAVQRIEAMRAIWTQDEASYSGPDVAFDRIWSWPKPLQPNGPAVLMGGSGPRSLARVVETAVEWMPMWPEIRRRLPEMLDELRRLADEMGRPQPPVTIYWGPQAADELKQLRGLGVGRVLLQVPTADRETVLAALDAYAPLVGELS